MKAYVELGFPLAPPPHLLVILPQGTLPRLGAGWRGGPGEEAEAAWRRRSKEARAGGLRSWGGHWRGKGHLWKMRCMKLHRPLPFHCAVPRHPGSCFTI